MNGLTGIPVEYGGGQITFGQTRRLSEQLSRTPNSLSYSLGRSDKDYRSLDREYGEYQSGIMLP